MTFMNRKNGVSHDILVANLEKLRERLCITRLGGRAAPRCDCKFGGSGVGEQSGCPELRQAIDTLLHLKSLGRLP